jgi:hypothetical protein
LASLPKRVIEIILIKKTRVQAIMGNYPKKEEKKRDQKKQ